MPKLKKYKPNEAKEQFQAPIEKKKKLQTQQIEKAFKIETENALKELQKSEKTKYVNMYREEAITETRRKRLAKTIRSWLSDYLESRYSVRDFERWRKQKPSEALPWAWKVVYGDGVSALGVQRGQVNVLIQLLTGQQPQAVVVSTEQALSPTITSVEIPNPALTPEPTEGLTDPENPDPENPKSP